MVNLNLICIFFLAIVVLLSSLYHRRENEKLIKEVKRLNEENKGLRLDKAFSDSKADRYHTDYLMMKGGNRG